jgi:flagellin-like hook-associated protein FlgL
LSVASSSTQNSLTIGGTASVLTGLGLTANDYQGVASTSAPNATRASLQSDFNNVLSQIDALAKDTSYNGINLLNGDNLKVVFNEHGTSSLTISGVTFDAAGLGLNTVSGAGFQSDTDVDAILAAVGTALGTLRTQASAFGSTLTTVQTRQDFTKNLIRTLQTGADNLVLADTNEEGANMLALQTRQQLSTTALSLSAQADQAVLRLFG